MQEPATIYAVSSGAGRAGVAVIRISGPRAGEVLERMAPPLPKPRMAAFRRIRHPDTGEVLDEALVLSFPGPKSETGEDMAELHVHGGGAVIRAVLGGVSRVTSCRLAAPGEFARRAFEHGKLDLTAAEGLADLVDAETEAQRRQAMAQAGGALAKLYDGWRASLIEARALLEAAIDFADEADVADRVSVEADAQIAALTDRIGRHLADCHRGEIVRDGFRVVLAGPPNVGKSSLLNALARRDAAIVSDEAGTTRDVIEVRLDLGGYAVVLTDTAGLRQADGAVEREGIRRTLERTAAADLVLWLVDGTAPVWSIAPGLADGAAPVVTIVTKADLATGTQAASEGAQLAVSARTGAGLPELTADIARRVAAGLGATSDAAPITQERHRASVAACLACLERYRAMDATAAPELKAEELRLAADALGRITGRVDVEDLLDRIFSRFCIGK